MTTGDGRVFVEEAGRGVVQLPGESPGQALAFNRRGDRVATWRGVAGTPTIAWWSVSDGALADEVAIDAPGSAPWRVVAESGRLAVAAEDSEVVLYDLESGRRLSSLPAADSGSHRMKLSPDGRRIAVVSWPRGVRIGTFGEGWGPQRSMTRGTLGPVIFSPDGALFVSGSDESLISVHDVGSGERIATLSGHRERILALTFAPDGRTLVSSSYDRTLRLWHRPTWRRLGVLERGATANYLGFDRSGGRLVSGSHHRPVSVFPKEAIGD